MLLAVSPETIPSKMPFHLVFELAAYIIALRLILFQKKEPNSLPLKEKTFVLTGAMVGALIGTKLLLVPQYLNLFWGQPQALLFLFVGTGKTIVGSLLGGIIGVELTKKLLKIKRSTGDPFVYPVMIGMIIGRIGCFLTGLEDETYGVPTQLPWGVDFGDGLLRHPTQLYEILFLILWIGFLTWRDRFPQISGERFKLFMVGYLSFRFLIDFLKPLPFSWWGLSSIQIACLIGLIYYHRSVISLFKFIGDRAFYLGQRIGQRKLG